MTPAVGVFLLAASFLAAAPVTSTCKDTPNGRECIVRAGDDVQFELLMKDGKRTILVMKQAQFDAPATRFYLKQSNELHDCFVIASTKDLSFFFVSPKNGAVVSDWTSAACDPTIDGVAGASPRLSAIRVRQIDDTIAAVKKLDASLEAASKKKRADCGAGGGNAEYCDCLVEHLPIGADFAGYNRFLAVDSPKVRAEIKAAPASDATSIAKQMIVAKDKCAPLAVK